MKTFITKILEDENGELSSMRFILIIWFMIVFVVWLVVAIKQFTIPDIPPGVTNMSAMILGGKVVQKFGER